MSLVKVALSGWVLLSGSSSNEELLRWLCFLLFWTDISGILIILYSFLNLISLKCIAPSTWVSKLTLLLPFSSAYTIISVTSSRFCPLFPHYLTFPYDFWNASKWVNSAEEHPWKCHWSALKSRIFFIECRFAQFTVYFLQVPRWVGPTIESTFPTTEHISLWIVWKKVSKWCCWLLLRTTPCILFGK